MQAWFRKTGRQVAWLRPVIGLAPCGVVAAFSTALFRTSPHKTAVPILSLALVLIVALLFGSLAGILGTLFSAIVFALFLFDPLGSMAVHDPAQKDSLMWMLMGGITLSVLFGRSSSANPSEKSHISER
jgi:K+-sensing histidine kinase KdpD